MLRFFRRLQYVQCFDTAAFPQIADIGFGVGKVGAVFPESDNAHQGGSALFELVGIGLGRHHYL